MKIIVSEKYLRKKDNITIKIPGAGNPFNLCCKNWRLCGKSIECCTEQVFWDPIRTRLSQGKVLRNQLVTLDCYFFPANIFNIGIITEIYKDSAVIFFYTGELVATDKKNIFGLPFTPILSSFGDLLQVKFDSIYRRRNNT